MNPASLGVGEVGLEGVGEKEGDAQGGNPVPAKWLIPLIPQISNVKS